MDPPIQVQFRTEKWHCYVRLILTIPSVSLSLHVNIVHNQSWVSVKEGLDISLNMNITNVEVIVLVSNKHPAKQVTETHN